LLRAARDRLEETGVFVDGKPKGYFERRTDSGQKERHYFHHGGLQVATDRAKPDDGHEDLIMKEFLAEHPPRGAYEHTRHKYADLARDVERHTNSDPANKVKKAYHGELDKDGVKHGEGTYFYKQNKGGSKPDDKPDAVVPQYTGQWKGGKKYGVGVFYHGDRDIQEGEWLDGTMEGEGELLDYDTRNLQAGWWVKGALVEGTMTFGKKVKGRERSFNGGYDKNGQKHGAGYRSPCRALDSIRTVPAHACAAETRRCQNCTLLTHTCCCTACACCTACRARVWRGFGCGGCVCVPGSRRCATTTPSGAAGSSACGAASSSARRTTSLRRAPSGSTTPPMRPRGQARARARCANRTNSTRSRTRRRTRTCA
jgi:hypothetical protein